MTETLAIPVALIPLSLAQIPDSTPAGMGNWLVECAAVLAIVYLVISLWKIISGHFAAREEPPREYVTAAACSEKHRDHSEELDEIRAEAHKRIEAIYGEIKSTRLETKNDIQAVHSRINDVLQAVADLGGQFKHLVRR